MSLTEALKETGDALMAEALAVVKEEGQAFVDENKDDAAEVGEDAANQLLLWARFEFKDIPILPKDAGMSEIEQHEILLAKRDGIFAKVAELERENAERIARMKARAMGFWKKLGSKLGQIGLKYATAALLVLI
jgi:hypothetical protein